MCSELKTKTSHSRNMAVDREGRGLFLEHLLLEEEEEEGAD